MKNDDMKRRPHPIDTLLRTATRLHMNRKVCSTLIYTLTEKEPTHTHTYAFMGYTLKGSSLHVSLSPTGKYSGSMLIRTDESGCRQHLKVINRYACIARRVELTPAIREAYKGYLEALEEDSSENNHHDHLSAIGKNSSLFWKAVSER